MSDRFEDGPHGGQGKWSDPRVPKRGWACVGITDLEEPSQLCEMCEKVTIRYVHSMHHPDYGDLECGCICSGHMEGDLDVARDRETVVRNRAGRRRNWPKLKAWHLSRSGNPTIDKDGCRVTVYQQRGSYRISAGRIGTPPRYGKRAFASLDAAIVASFDAFMWAREQ